MALSVADETDAGRRRNGQAYPQENIKRGACPAEKPQHVGIAVGRGTVDFPLSCARLRPHKDFQFLAEQGSILSTLPTKVLLRLKFLVRCGTYLRG